MFTARVHGYGLVESTSTTRRQAMSVTALVSIVSLPALRAVCLIVERRRKRGTSR